MQRSALEEAWAPMLSVVPEQRWGITAGVPAGWPVAQKNGFAGSQCCGGASTRPASWWIRRGGAYAVTILSDGWPTRPPGYLVSRREPGRLPRNSLVLTHSVGAVYDRDGDGRDDPVVMGNGTAPSQQHWYWAASAVGYVEDLLGATVKGAATRLLSGDVDGDGRADPNRGAARRNGDLQWWVAPQQRRWHDVCPVRPCRRHRDPRRLRR